MRAGILPTILGGLAAWGFYLLLGGDPAPVDFVPGTISASGPRLLSVEPLAGMNGAECVVEPVNFSLGPGMEQPAFVSQPGFQESRTPDSGTRQAESITRSPLRVIRDKYAAFSGVAVDLKHNEVVTTDENLFQILVYDRQANTPPTASMTEPKCCDTTPKGEIPRRSHRGFTKTTIATPAIP